PLGAACARYRDRRRRCRHHSDRYLPEDDFAPADRQGTRGLPRGCQEGRRQNQGRMSEQAKSVQPTQAAAAAVKAYIKLNRATLAADGELLALLMPERSEIGEARDFQRFVIDRLTAENAKLRAERDALLGREHASLRMGDGVRRFVLELIDARSFAEAIA